MTIDQLKAPAGVEKVMMRHGKVDANQEEIVDAFRRGGASVLSLADMGQGCPDLLVGYQGKNYLVEVKTPEGALNAYQVQWHNLFWNGQVCIVRTVDEALKLLGVLA